MGPERIPYMDLSRQAIEVSKPMCLGCPDGRKRVKGHRDAHDLVRKPTGNTIQRKLLSFGCLMTFNALYK
jgi:hypothetical protein